MHKFIQEDLISFVENIAPDKLSISVSTAWGDGTSFDSVVFDYDRDYGKPDQGETIRVELNGKTYDQVETEIKDRIAGIQLKKT